MTNKNFTRKVILIQKLIFFISWCEIEKKNLYKKKTVIR
jgi:hypothetical protein